MHGCREENHFIYDLPRLGEQSTSSNISSSNMFIMDTFWNNQESYFAVKVCVCWLSNLQSIIRIVCVCGWRFFLKTCVWYLYCWELGLQAQNNSQLFKYGYFLTEKFSLLIWPLILWEVASYLSGTIRDWTMSGRFSVHHAGVGPQFTLLTVISHFSRSKVKGKESLEII